jgi:hypothetical protein
MRLRLLSFANAEQCPDSRRRLEVVEVLVVLQALEDCKSWQKEEGAVGEEVSLGCETRPPGCGSNGFGGGV